MLSETERLTTNPIPSGAEGERSRQFVSGLKDFATFMLDKEGRITSWNAGAQRIKGYSREEIVGKHFSVFYPKEYVDEGRPERELKTALEQGQSEEEGWRVRKNGSKFWANSVITPIFGNSGEHVGFAKVIHDITERRQADDALKESEAKFRLVVESSPNAIVMADHLGRIILVNAQTEKMFGYNRNELIGQSVELLVPPRFRQHHPSYRNSFMGDPKSRPMGAGRDLFGLRKDGSEVPVEIALTPIRTEKEMYVLSSIVDITERKRLEERFRLVVESAPNAMIMVNQQGEIVLLNSQSEKLFGYSREELLGRSIDILVPYQFRGNHPKYRDNFTHDPQARPMGAGRDLFGLRKDGSQVPIEIGLNPIETDQGVFVLASVVDITERKRAEERFRLVVESSPNGMIMVNEAGEMVLVNSQAEKLFGYAREELLGKSVDMLVPEQSRGKHPSFRKGFTSDPHARPMGAGRDLYGLRKDGTQVPIEIGLNPVRTESGFFVLSSIVDITERKRAEDALLKQARELEQFAYVSSHDLQEPLRKVASYAQMLESRFKGQLGEEGGKYVKNIAQGTSRMQSLIKDLLDYSRLSRQERKREEVDLKSVLARVVDDLESLVKENRADIQSGNLPVVQADSVQMHQVFLNLIGNAIKFHSEEYPRVRVFAEPTKNEWIIGVQDNGIGIDSKYADQIFKVFQRLHTKGKYQGTGIGLAICKKVVEQHGGRIWVESKPGAGSTFYFTLPYSDTQESNGEDKHDGL